MTPVSSILKKSTPVNCVVIYVNIAIILKLSREEVTPHIALVNSQDAVTIKHLVENAVWQLILGNEAMVCIFYIHLLIEIHKFWIPL